MFIGEIWDFRFRWFEEFEAFIKFPVFDGFDRFGFCRSEQVIGTGRDFNLGLVKVFADFFSRIWVLRQTPGLDGSIFIK